jgi:hypothetical protein
LGNGYYNIKSFFYPRYCLSTSSGALTILFTCNPSDPNQRFRVVTESVVPFESYNAYIFARKDEIDTGHAWFALIREKGTYFYNLSNNTSTKLVLEREVATHSAWPKNGQLIYGMFGNFIEKCGFDPNVPTINCKKDVDNTNEILYTNNFENGNWAYRTTPITKAGYDFFKQSGANSTNCKQYALLAAEGCTCVSQATREWKNLTGEDFNQLWTPKQLFEAIILRNRQ